MPPKRTYRKLETNARDRAGYEFRPFYFLAFLLSSFIPKSWFGSSAFFQILNRQFKGKNGRFDISYGEFHTCQSIGFFILHVVSEHDYALKWNWSKRPLITVLLKTSCATLLSFTKLQKKVIEVALQPFFLVLIKATPLP